MSSKNIVLFGQSGAGMSSVINLMAGEKKANISPGTDPCTKHWKEYSISFDGCDYKVFDTIGFREQGLGVEEHLAAIANMHGLIKKLDHEGGIDLLLFCVRAGQFALATQNNYRLIYESLCEKKVPIILVLTGLEREQIMEDWWTNYKSTFDKYDIVVDGHACITAANGLDGRHQLLYEESRCLVRKLVREHARKGRMNIILFGQSGSGKSSVVNLMAGKNMAKTSPDMQRCTLNWEEHTVAFDGHNYKVFDTVGLETSQLGIEDYFKTIQNAHGLITKLNQEGGVHLLLFCVQARKFTSAIQNNYQLFYEWLCEKKVPIVLVITGLETEQNMEDWWTRCKPTFDSHRIVVDGHACITAANGLDGRHQQLYEESRKLVRNIVREHTHNGKEVTLKGVDGYKGGGGRMEADGWFRRFMCKLRELFPGNHASKKHIETVLIERFGMPREAAVQLAGQVRE